MRASPRRARREGGERAAPPPTSPRRRDRVQIARVPERRRVAAATRCSSGALLEIALGALPPSLPLTARRVRGVLTRRAVRGVGESGGRWRHRVEEEEEGHAPEDVPAAVHRADRIVPLVEAERETHERAAHRAPALRHRAVPQPSEVGGLPRRVEEHDDDREHDRSDRALRSSTARAPGRRLWRRDGASHTTPRERATRQAARARAARAGSRARGSAHRARARLEEEGDAAERPAHDIAP